MRLTKKKSAILLIASVLVGLSVAFVFQKNSGTKSELNDSDISLNKIYSEYVYGEPETIYIGTQPLYSPTGLISETMRRDSVLKEELSKLGFKIIFYPFLKGYDVNQLLIQGHLQAGVGGDMPTLSVAASTEIIIPLMFQSGPTWLVTRSSVLLKDLTGKRIAYAKGSNAHYMLLNLLSSFGFSKSDFELVPMNVNKMIAALESGTISAFAAWEPTPEIARNKHKFVSRFGGPSSGYMYFRKDFSDKHPAEMKLIVAAAARAYLWLRDGSHDDCLRASAWAIEISEKLSKMKLQLYPEEQLSIAKRDIFRSRYEFSLSIPKEDFADEGRLEKEFIFLKKIGMIPKETLWKNIQKKFDTEILSSIRNAPGKFRLSEFRFTEKPLVTETP